jgi:hypothetical protein
MRDAPRGGLFLVSGKRTDYMQWLLRHERVPGHECDPSYPCYPPTAIPGRSNHRNLSYDIAAADMGGIDLYWLGQNQRKYGLHRPISGERWHFECRGTPTVRILRYGQTADPNDGHHWVQIGPGDYDGVNGNVYKRGGYNNEVAEAQIRLKNLAGRGWTGCDPGTIDGVFGGSGSRTSLASIAFHKKIQQIQRDMGQPVWPQATPVIGPLKIGMLRWWTA